MAEYEFHKAVIAPDDHHTIPVWAVVTDDDGRKHQVKFRRYGDDDALRPLPGVVDDGRVSVAAAGIDEYTAFDADDDVPGPEVI